VKPNVVMSGINSGQNLGASVDLSGTVGAARMAATRGIPGLAVSQGFGDAPQYQNAAKIAVDWLKQHRAALAKKPKRAPTTITNINVPNCPTGKPRGLKDVELANTAVGAIAQADCAAAMSAPTSDIEGFNAGWAVESDVPTTPSTPAG
jgi:5'-nucleotidase